MSPREVPVIAITRAEDARSFAESVAQGSGWKLAPDDWLVWAAQSEDSPQDGLAGYMILKDEMVRRSEQAMFEMAFDGALSQLLEAAVAT
jgi:hypothetical protein